MAVHIGKDPHLGAASNLSTSEIATWAPLAVAGECALQLVRMFGL